MTWTRSRRRPATAPDPDPPLTWRPLSGGACLGLLLATRTEPDAAAASARPFRDREAILVALGHGALALDETVRVGAQITTAGRFLVAECVPAALRAEVQAAPLTAARLAALLARIAFEDHVEIAARCAAAMEQLGRFVADRSGASLAIGDFVVPPGRDAILARAAARVAEVRTQYEDGLVTDGERYNATVDAWADAAAGIQASARATAPRNDPLAALAAASDGPPAEYARAIDGVLAKPSGEVHEVPVVHTPGEGLTPHEAMMAAMAARSHRVRQAERDRGAAQLLHVLRAVIGPTRVVIRDCETRRGVHVRRLAQVPAHLPGPFALSLAGRIVGRVAAADVVSRDGDVLARAGALLTRPLAARIEAAHVASVLVRDPITCAAQGVCAICLGLDPDDATWNADGDAVGSRAALAIARGARAFTTRTFHIC
jgi:hypothetical protein